MNRKNLGTNGFELRQLALPEWKKFWDARGFTQEMKGKGILDKAPEVMKRIFHTGPFFMVVLNYTNMRFEYIEGVEHVLGYSHDEFNRGNLDFLVGLLHPEDAPKVFGLSVYYQKFLDRQPKEKRLDYKASINLRMKTASGSYVTLLEQVVSLNMDEAGRVTHALKYFTDISHLSYSTQVVFAISDHKHGGNQHFQTYSLEGSLEHQIKDGTTANLSERERDILALVARGLTSKEIAQTLQISHHTVNKHRENMLRKTGSKNLNEVLSFAYCNDYL